MQQSYLDNQTCFFSKLTFFLNATLAYSLMSKPYLSIFDSWLKFAPRWRYKLTLNITTILKRVLKHNLSALSKAYFYIFLVQQIIFIEILLYMYTACLHVWSILTDIEFVYFLYVFSSILSIIPYRNVNCCSLFRHVYTIFVWDCWQWLHPFQFWRYRIWMV